MTEKGEVIAVAADLDLYRIFYHVAKYQNFTRAAEVLLSSQPSVTRAMQSLESELGCRLFVRSGRGVQLTAEGQLLYSRIAPAYESIVRAEEEIAGALSLSQGAAYLGTTGMALHCLLLHRLRAFCTAFPGIRLRISDYSTPQAIRALQAGSVDMATITTPAQLPAGLRRTALGDFEEVMVGGPRFAALASGSHTLSQLTQYPLVGLSSDTVTYAFYRDIYAESALDFSPDVQLSTSDLVLPAIAHDLGIGFVPLPIARPALQSGQVVRIPLAQPLPRRQVWLLTDPRRSLSPAARALYRALRQQDF